MNTVFIGGSLKGKASLFQAAGIYSQPNMHVLQAAGNKRLRLFRRQEFTVSPTCMFFKLPGTKGFAFSSGRNAACTGFCPILALTQKAMGTPSIRQSAKYDNIIKGSGILSS